MLVEMFIAVLRLVGSAIVDVGLKKNIHIYIHVFNGKHTFEFLILLEKQENININIDFDR